MIGNLLLWSAQVFLVVMVGAAASLALRDARARLHFWQGILAIILLLPAAALWQQPAPQAAIAISTSHAPVTIAPPLDTPRRTFPERYLFGFLAAGAALRLAWLTIGLFRLRRFRRGAVTLHQPPVAFAGQVGWYLSESVSGPVTYGWPRSSILLPARFLEMPASVQEAIASHELMHVHRGDWLFVMAEEIVRGVLWFHPAVWFVLSRIQLAREQVVDREVVRATNDRAGYLDALMAVAAQKLQPDVAPAPLFLKKRQLAERVAAILKETSMSGSRLVARVSAAISAAVFGVFAAVWLFPLQIPAQIMPDDAGITIDAGAPLLHRPPLRSPVANLTGDVIVEATLNNKGEVTDAHVLSGPEEARKTVLASVLDWHYSSATVPPQLVHITVHFSGGPASQILTPPPPPPPPPPPTGVLGRLIGRDGGAPPPPPPPPPPATLLPAKLNTISFPGLTPELLQQIQSRMTLRVGDTLDRDGFARLGDTLKQIDEHLRTSLNFGGRPGDPQNVNLTISLQQAGQIRVFEVPKEIIATVRVGGKDSEGLLIRKVAPTYPEEAKQAHLQGTVRLSATIGTDGSVQSLQPIEGNPILVNAAVPAVSQWLYQPYMLNGAPVPVKTEIILNFVLN